MTANNSGCCLASSSSAEANDARSTGVPDANTGTSDGRPAAMCRTGERRRRAIAIADDEDEDDEGVRAGLASFNLRAGEGGGRFIERRRGRDGDGDTGLARYPLDADERL